MYSCLLTLPWDPIRSLKLKLVWALKGFIEIRYGWYGEKIESLSNLLFPVIIRRNPCSSSISQSFYCFQGEFLRY